MFARLAISAGPAIIASPANLVKLKGRILKPCKPHNPCNHIASLTFFVLLAIPASISVIA